MKTKTCGECRHFDGRYNLCAVTSDFCTVEPDYSACDDFEQKPKPTNADRIRQMSDTDLAEMLVYPVKPMNIDGNIHYEFTSCLLLGKSYPMREQAVFLTEKRLNSPAESEG
jgi:hypothetical protein